MQLSYFQAQMVIQHREQEKAFERMNTMLRAAHPEPASVRHAGLIERMFRGRSSALRSLKKREAGVATA